MKKVVVNGMEIGGDKLVVVAGPCVIESAELCLEVAGRMKDICAKLELPYIFKASFDKANRTALAAQRGIGLGKGLAALQKVKEKYGIPVLTDVHSAEQVEPVSAVADVIQIPAFLCRQTDLVVAAGASGKVVNIKKGQFLSPYAMRNIVDKARQGGGGDKVVLTERGTTFGYDQLVVDMPAITIMKSHGCPVLFDVTHSLQIPPGKVGNVSGGRREYALPLGLAGVAAGADGLFLEVHPRPDKALSDPATSLDYQAAAELIEKATAIFAARG